MAPNLQYLFTLLSLSSLYSTTAFRLRGDECPEYWDIANRSTMTTFDLSKFIGDHYWYEHYSHDVPIATSDCNCVRYHQTSLNGTNPNYNDEFNCRKKSVDNNDITEFNSTLYPNYVNKTEGGKMTEAVLGSSASEYWVLDESNDYQYVLVYACVQMTPFDKDDFVYMFSRNYTAFPDDLHQRWISYLDSKGVYTKNVIPIEQDGCWD